MRAAATQDVKVSHFADIRVEAPPDLDPIVDLDGIRDELTTNSLTAPRLEPISGRDYVWTFRSESGDRLVSFDRATVEQAEDGVELVMYGTANMVDLLDS